MEIHEHKAHELRSLLKKGEISSVEITKAFLKRIDTIDPTINSFLNITHETALSQAEKADNRIKNNDAGPLTGVPYALKDVIVTKGITTTCGSKMLYNFKPTYDATVYNHLEKAGMVMLGKTNMDEFAMGSSNENSAFCTCKNPWDIERIPGGSSGGSAAAVAAELAPVSLGSDTGGSIRQPASHCGVIGMKPTYGRVSRYGLIAFASSLDQIGPFARSTEDIAELLNIISGHDQCDSTSVQVEIPDYTKALNKEIKGIKIGVPHQYFTEGIDPDVKKAVKKTLITAEGLGAEIIDIDLPHTEYAVAVYYIIAPAEASSNLARYDGVKYGYRFKETSQLMDMYKKTRLSGFGPEVKRRILIGTFALSAGYYDAYFKKASQIRTLIISDFKNAFKNVDVIMAPVAPTAAFKFGLANDPLKMYLSDIFTLPASLAGIPGMSLPCGFDSNNMPIGLQILGSYFNEEIILTVANALEKTINFDYKKILIPK